MSFLADKHYQYTKGSLSRKDLPLSPFEQLENWLAVAQNISETFNAFSLATADRLGIPSVRVVLLKNIDTGLCFYTDSRSNKGKQLAENSKAEALFYWPDLQRQVRVSGGVEIIDGAIRDAYFRSRPYESQISAQASCQSSPVENRSVLERQVETLKEHYKEEVPVPDFWKGYRIIPNTFEFWQGRDNRLHDRFQYTFQAHNEWKITRLSP